jgi:hypothetical protein
MMVTAGVVLPSFGLAIIWMGIMSDSIALLAILSFAWLKIFFLHKTQQNRNQKVELAPLLETENNNIPERYNNY